METVADSLTPDDIDLAFVGELVPDLEIANVGADQIVIGGATQLVVLNPTAALILQFLDGEATLRELVDDFADVLDADRAVIEADVLGFVRELGANGLLEGVALPAPEVPDWLNFDPVEPLEPGDELDDFTLPDLDGHDRSLSDFRGRRTLLVNWSPGCGYCVRIADELGALHPLLEDHDVELVFLAMGDADANRAVFDAAGVTASTLLRTGGDSDAFRGTGTPAAYLLDEDGRLVETMVVGANQVPALARDLAGVDPATPYVAAGEIDGDADDEAADDGVRGQYLPAPGAMCGPGGGGGGSNNTEWVGTRAYALGGYHVGVRYDAPETADVLDRLFAGARINDRRVPDNYSVALGDSSAAGGAARSRSLKLLVQGSRQLVRSRSSARVLGGLLQYLSADLAPDDESLTRVSATALVGEGGALLLPPGLVDAAKQLQPRLARAGLAMVDTPHTLLDVGTRELVVPTPGVAHDAVVVAELDDRAGLGRELPRVLSGRYPLRAWFLSRGPDQLGVLSPAIAVTAALSLLHDLDDLVFEVERIGDLFTAVPGVGVWYQNLDELVDQVQRALD